MRSIYFKFDSRVTSRGRVDPFSSHRRVIEMDHSFAHHQETALFIAAKEGKLNVVRFLVGKGAALEKANSTGWTPLIIASRNGHLEVVRYLLEQGANSKAGTIGWTPLHHAAHGNHLNVARLLVEYGVDLNTNLEMANIGGETPLINAARMGYLDFVRFLVEQGADIDKADNGGLTPLIHASRSGYGVIRKQRFLEVTRYLLEQGANRDKTDNTGKTPLHWAALHGQLEAAKLLMVYGADLNARDNRGWRAELLGLIFFYKLFQRFFNTTITYLNDTFIGRFPSFLDKSLISGINLSSYQSK